MEKMTVGGEGVWYKYHPRHPQNDQVCQTLEPPRQDTEVPRQSAEVPRRPEQIRIQLGWLFCGWDYLRCRWSFEHLVPPSISLVSPLIVWLVV